MLPNFDVPLKSQKAGRVMVLLTSITWISRIYFYVSILIPSLQAKNWENYSKVNNVWRTRSILYNYPMLLNCTLFVQSMVQLWINHCSRRVLYGINCHGMKKKKPSHMSFEIFYTCTQLYFNHCYMYKILWNN